MGFWVDGRFAWLDDSGWRKSLRYESNTLVTQAICEHEGLGVSLTVSDCVAHHADILLRRVDVTNHWPAKTPQGATCACSSATISTSPKPTLAIRPSITPICDALVHYKRDMYFLLGGEAGGGWTVSVYDGHQRLWRRGGDMARCGGRLAFHEPRRAGLGGHPRFPCERSRRREKP